MDGLGLFWFDVETNWPSTGTVGRSWLGFDDARVLLFDVETTTVDSAIFSRLFYSIDGAAGSIFFVRLNSQRIWKRWLYGTLVLIESLVVESRER